MRSERNTGTGRSKLSAFAFVGSLIAVVVILGMVGFFLGRLTTTPQQASERVDPDVTQITSPLVTATVEDTLAVRGRIRPLKLVYVPVPDAQLPVVTELSVKEGGSVEAGDVLGEVNGRPLLVLSGLFPAYRDFEPGIAPGPDVWQLESALASLGLFQGQPDEIFQAESEAAVDRLYESVGYRSMAPGLLPRGEVVFLPDGAGAVERLTIQLGDVFTSDAIQLGTGGSQLEIGVDSLQRLLLEPGQIVRLYDSGGNLLMESHIRNVRDLSDTEETDNVAIELDDPLQPSVLDHASEDVVAKFVLAQSIDSALAAIPSAVFTKPDGTAYVVINRGLGEEEVLVTVGVVSADYLEVISNDGRLVNGVALVLNPAPR